MKNKPDEIDQSHPTHDKHGKAIQECKQCGQIAPSQGRGLCARCYRKAARDGSIIGYPMIKDATRKFKNQNQIVLTFSDHDLPLLDQLRGVANRERRPIDQQILLWIEERLASA